ncbi:MAG: hypothetical protein ACR2MS_13015 [Weeksellaceae bacterium]
MSLLSVFIVAFISIYATFWFSIHLKQGSVRASAGLSLLVALVVYNLPITMMEGYREQIPVVFFGASFMGMVSKEVMASWYLFVLSSIVFAIVFTSLGNNFAGYGGGLGMQACISIIAVLGIDYVWIVVKNYYDRTFSNRQTVNQESKRI